MQSNFGVAKRANGNELCHPRADGRSAMDQTLDLKSQGDDTRKHGMKGSRRHAARDRTDPIFERRRKSRFRVNIDYDSSAWPKKGYQAEKGLLGLGAMLDHAHTEDFVEEAPPKWKLIDAGLKHVKLRFVLVICVGSADGTAQIKRKNLCTGFERKLRKAPGSTSGFQNALAWESFRPTCTIEKPVTAEIIPHEGVHLQRWKLIPLEAKRGSVIIGLNKARHGSHNGILHCALMAAQRTVFDLAIIAMVKMLRKRQSSPAVQAFQIFKEFDSHLLARNDAAPIATLLSFGHMPYAALSARSSKNRKSWRERR